MTVPTAPPPAFDYVGGNPELDALLAEEERAKSELDAAKERHKELADRLKAAFTSVLQATPDPAPFNRYNVRVPGQAPRQLAWRTTRRINTNALKAEQPGIYQAYSKEAGAWYWERVK